MAAGKNHYSSAQELLSDTDLVAGLRAVMAVDLPESGIELVGRSPNPRAGARPSEVVQLRVGGDAVPELFLKYGAGDDRDRVGYESRVYQDLLGPLGFTVPGCYGSFPVARPEASVCLVLESLPRVVRVDESTPLRLVAAASWIGLFHRATRSLTCAPEAAFLRRYDRSEMLRPMGRVLDLAAGESSVPAWLPRLAARFEALVSSLVGKHASLNASLIHGSYGPANIVASEWAIHPVAWGRAGIGPGEIDFAALTRGWSAAETEECLLAWVESRWPDGAPQDLEDRLAAARLYLRLRSLGDVPPAGETPETRGTSIFDDVYDAALESGLRLSGPAGLALDG